MTNMECQFEQEMRLAIVMYGGISLAIYMNGITQELYHLVRATAPKEEMSTLLFCFWTRGRAQAN